MTEHIVEISGFKVSGLKVRTKNSDEFDPGTAKIGNLWGQFFAQQLPGKIPDQTPDPRMLGVYSNYESDANGAFDVTAGMTVQDFSPDFSETQIPGGRYLVFVCQGVMPAAVIQGWGRVWSFFQNDTELVRRFAADFEDYRSPGEVAIYIGIV